MAKLSVKLQKQLLSAGIVLVVLFYTLATQPTELPHQASASPTPTTSPHLDPSPTVLGINNLEFVPVTSITDGDTFKVRIGDSIETVRLVGVNTPETKDPRKSVECFGKEASAALKQLLTEQSVRLENDPTQSNRDRYGRLLRFAFLDSGQDVGLWLLEHGYALESLYSTVPHRYRDAYLEAQQKAEAEHRGLWNPAVCEQE